MELNAQNKRYLLSNYLKGNLTEKEESNLVDWINSSGENYQEFKKYIEENQFTQSTSKQTIQAWVKMKVKLTHYSTQQENKKIIVPNWLKIAAIVIIALMAGFFASQTLQKDHYSNLMNEVIVPNGEKAQLVLSDGTVVYLNSGSHFRYPAIFSEKERLVNLTGEAFFEVTKDKTSPFMIKSPKFNVKVIGTSFNLKAYPEDLENTLTLHTGEVAITNSGKEFKIRPGEKYIFNTNTQKSNIIKSNIKRSFLWEEGVIVIDNLNLEEIRKVLERKFDVKIIIANEKLNVIEYTGQFKPYETLEEVLELIRETSPVKFKIEINETKDIITIR